MEQREIDEIKRQLDEAQELPEKAMALILKVLGRMASHLESERDQRVQLLTVLEASKVTMETFKRQIEGHYENGDRKPGIMERFDRIETQAAESKEEAKATRQQGKENNALLKKFFLTFIGSILTGLILWGVGHIHFK